MNTLFINKNDSSFISLKEGMEKTIKIIGKRLLLIQSLISI